MNFFQVPNFLWDREDLDVYERVILTHIIRKTIGWGKSEDGISLSQFQKALGISKNTIIKTLKKLIEKNIINKKSTLSENGSQSFNSYSLTDEIIKLANSSSRDEQGVVHEMNRGSSRDEQGVVHEMNTQNTSNTKDTNTKDTNTKESKKEKINKKEKSLLEEVLEKAHIKSLMRNLNIDESFLMELFYYREQIGKPFKTEKAVSGLLNDLLMCKLKTKKSAEEIFEIMEIQGWKTIKAEWIKNIEEEPVTSNNEESDNISEVQRALAMLNS